MAPLVLLAGAFAACPTARPDLPAGLVVVVDKAAFELGVYRDGSLTSWTGGAACFPVALGGAPAGDKRERGDERTPEGWYRITHRNPASSFHKSLGLSYPAARHARLAYAEGRISAAVRDRVVAADAPGRMPARDTSLGGDIYVHGGGSWPSWWTDGCVALTNDAMDWLYAEAGPGTMVRIDP